jgi:hypothetical protein
MQTPMLSGMPGGSSQEKKMTKARYSFFYQCLPLFTTENKKYMIISSTDLA